jgi:hypothetical protein
MGAIAVVILIQPSCPVDKHAADETLLDVNAVNDTRLTNYRHRFTTV